MGEGTTTSTYPSRVLDRTATAHIGDSQDGADNGGHRREAGRRRGYTSGAGGQEVGSNRRDRAGNRQFDRVGGVPATFVAGALRLALAGWVDHYDSRRRATSQSRSSDANFRRNAS